MSNPAYSVPLITFYWPFFIFPLGLIEQPKKKKSFALNKYQPSLPRRTCLPHLFISTNMFKVLFSRPALAANVSTTQVGKRIVAASAVGVFAYTTVQQCRKDVLFYTSKSN
ncbi:hypothetical protein INT44_001493 [Umbelopsis vinacea]|uniref:Uncharacterized protein n=1 Tax=Umbelopsis vinacea TaxID=44442 RepID=A0A8H7UFU6_9FUNG|nr:hypothetical protein INT44_001493 [Umbelopsis vinacea]